MKKKRWTLRLTIALPEPATITDALRHARFDLMGTREQRLARTEGHGYPGVDAVRIVRETRP